MALKKLMFVLVLFVLSVTKSWCIYDHKLSEAEDSLKILFQALTSSDRKGGKEFEKITNNIISILSETLRLKESFNYGFDSLPLLGKITASDNMLRIYTWNYPLSPVDHKYYCFLQYRENDNGEISVFSLNQADTDKEDMENNQFQSDNWYGALYYQVHPVIYSDTTFYTVMGFDFNNIYTNIKILDVLYFADGLPVLGAPVFQFRDKIQNRVVFEYSSRAVMFLRYIPEMDMIVYDHLSPSAPRFKDQYRYYGPDFSYDGFRFENRRWIHVSDVDWK